MNTWTSEKCKTCKYRAAESKDWKCEYSAIMGHSRRCEPGDLCTEYEQGDRISLDNSINIYGSFNINYDTWLDKFIYVN